MKTSLEELIAEQESLISHIGRRICFLQAYDSELYRLAQDSEISNLGPSFYELVKDSFYMTVIDLTALAENLFADKYSLFCQLQMHIHEIQPKKITEKDFKNAEYVGGVDLTESEKDEITRRIKERRILESQRYIDEANLRVFGEVKKKISVADLENTRIKGSVLIKELKGYRDHLAHRFEREERKKAKKNAVKIVELERLATIFEDIKQLIADLRLTGLFSQFAYYKENPEDYTEEALDIIHLIMNGSIRSVYFDIKSSELLLGRKDFQEIREHAIEKNKEYWIIKG